MKKLIFVAVLFLAYSATAMENPRQKQHAFNRKASKALIALLKNAPHFEKTTPAQQQQLLTSIRNLLMQGANPNSIDQLRAPNDVPLILAISRNNLEAVTLLLGEGANPNAIVIRGPDVITPLTQAVTLADNNNFQIVELLLAAGADPNKPNVDLTPLMIAAQRNNLNLAKLLLKHGANPNLVVLQHYSALYFALLFNDDAMIRLLTNAGADIQNAFQAIFEHNPNFVDVRHVSYFLKYGLDVNMRNRAGNPLITITLLNNNIDAMRLLLEHGASPDIPNNQGFTPLMLAALTKKPHLAQLLLENGAQTDLKNKNNQTALDIAMKGQTGAEIEAMLRNPPPLKKLKKFKKL